MKKNKFIYLFSFLLCLPICLAGFFTTSINTPPPIIYNVSKFCLNDGTGCNITNATFYYTNVTMNITNNISINYRYQVNHSNLTDIYGVNMSNNELPYHLNYSIWKYLYNNIFTWVNYSFLQNNYYNKTEIDIMKTNYYNKTEVDALIYNATAYVTENFFFNAESCIYEPCVYNVSKSPFDDYHQVARAGRWWYGGELNGV